MQETDQTNIDASIDLMYNISLQTIIQDRLGFQLTFSSLIRHCVAVVDVDAVAGVVVVDDVVIVGQL